MTQEVRGNMSHVDDGTLHAYLDGELLPVERAGLEAHVAECAACRGRLEEERALIERASNLLGLAQPPERSAPPLHQLRPPRLTWRLRVPLAWAATVVFALGIGYYVGGRDIPAASRAPTLPESDAQNAPAVDSAATLARQEDGLVVKAARQLAARPQARVAAPARKEAAPEPQMYIDGAPLRSERESASVGLRSSAAADSAAAQSGVITIQPRDAARRAATPAAQAPAPAIAEAIVTTGSNLAEARGRLVATQWPIIRRGPARDILGAEPLGIPGLAVRNIRRSPSGAIVLVEQAIDSATVIQLFQERAESDQFARHAYGRFDSAQAREEAARVQLRGVAAGTERLARFIGGVRVEIAGPLSTDSLNRLLEQVKPIGP
jgi:hypothetical protein